jgi:hypothetical protein
MRMLGDGASDATAQAAARGGYGQAAAGSAGYGQAASSAGSGYGAAGGGAASGYGSAGGGGGAGGGGAEAVLQQLLSQGFSMQEVMSLVKSRPDLAAKLGLTR